jgi:hypothetical protein
VLADVVADCARAVRYWTGLERLEAVAGITLGVDVPGPPGSLDLVEEVRDGEVVVPSLSVPCRPPEVRAM